jgi:hypothetical protein
VPWRPWRLSSRRKEIPDSLNLDYVRQFCRAIQEKKNQPVLPFRVGIMAIHKAAMESFWIIEELIGCIIKFTRVIILVVSFRELA